MRNCVAAAAVVERQARLVREAVAAGPAVIPVVADLGPENHVGLGPPVQPGGKFIEIALEAVARPGPHAGHVPRPGNHHAVLVAEPFGPHAGGPLAVERVDVVLIQPIPLGRAAVGRRVVLHAQVMDQDVLAARSEFFLNDKAVDKTILGAAHVLRSAGQGVGHDRSPVAALPTEAAEKVQRRGCRPRTGSSRDGNRPGPTSSRPSCSRPACRSPGAARRRYSNRNASKRNSPCAGRDS